MHLVEVLEGRWQLCQYRLRVTQVHASHVVTLGGVDEALGHAVALRAADGRVDGLQAQSARQRPRFGGDVGTAVVTEELQLLSLRDRFDRAESAFDGLDEHLANRLAWQPLALPCTPGQHLTVAAVLGEGGRHGLTRIALDFQTIGAPSRVAARDRNTALMRACRLAPARRLGQQQSGLYHDAIDAFAWTLGGRAARWRFTKAQARR